MQVAVRICREVALGLHAAHEARSEDGTILHLVHRDVSPQNILIGFDGTVRVTDFGIAKALGNVNQTNAGVLKGNMGYLSPEQLRFEEPDRRSDFFSLGVTLYELLSGARLYSNTDGFDGTRRILTEPPPDIGEIRSDVPAELVELLFEMLSKEREARPSSGLDIATRLEGILAPLIAEEGSVTVADHMDQHFALDRQRHRAFLADHLRRLEAEPTAPRATPSSLPLPPRPHRCRSAAVCAGSGSGAPRRQPRWRCWGPIAWGRAASPPNPAPFPHRRACRRARHPGHRRPVRLRRWHQSARRRPPRFSPPVRPRSRYPAAQEAPGSRAGARAAARDQAPAATLPAKPDGRGHFAVPLFTKWR